MPAEADRRPITTPTPGVPFDQTMASLYYAGEHNPEIDKIINAARRLDVEFVLDVAPANRKPA